MRQKDTGEEQVGNWGSQQSSTHAVTKRKGKDWPGHVISRQTNWQITEVTGWTLKEGKHSQDNSELGGIIKGRSFQEHDLVSLCKTGIIEEPWEGFSACRRHLQTGSGDDCT